MIDFLRRHSLATLLISVILVAVGSWALFFQDPDDLSDTAMFLVYAGFVVFCSGLVGLMIIIFRPIEVSRDDAARWEITRLEGKTRFMIKFLGIASPFLIGVFVAIWDSADAASFVLIVCLFLGVSLLVAHSLWQFLQREHGVIAGSESKGGPEKQLLETAPDEISDVGRHRERSPVFRKKK